MKLYPLKNSINLAFRFCIVLLLVGSSSVLAAENFRMSTLGPGTSPYLTMTTFANIINKTLPDYAIQVNATGAATKHAVQVGKFKTDFSMSSPSLFALMATQSAMYKKMDAAPELAKNLRAVFNFPMGLYHGVTYADSGIKSLQDIKGKRVFAGPPGGAARVTMERLIKAVTGYEAGKDYESVKLGWDAASQSFLDSHIDVYFNPTNAPSPIVQQFTLTKKIRFLGIPDESLETPGIKKLSSRPGFRIDQLKAGTYGENQVNTEDVNTIAVTVGISTHTKLSDDVIYNMTKAFWENVDSMKQDTPWLRNIAIETALSDLNMPIHPGAQKYYEEVGLTIPEINVPEKQ